MGCTQGTPAVGRGSTKVTTESLDAKFSKVKQRDGHPSYYKSDGYEFGIRVNAKGNRQTVFIGTSRANGDKVTIKEYHLANNDEKLVVEELILLSKLNHEALPKLREVFITNFSLFAVTDYIDNLRLSAFVDIKAKKSKLSHPEIKLIFQQLVEGVQYCHNNKIIIRHLMPGNIMVKKLSDTAYSTKIIDFSLAVETGSLSVLYDHPMFDWAQVPYLSPEALLGHPYTCTMDCWSLGVLLYSMFCGELPFDAAEDSLLVDKIKAANYSFEGAAWVSVDPHAKDLIDRLLVTEELRRFQCHNILTHPYLRDVTSK